MSAVRADASVCQANAATQQAVHHCECPICFEPMHGEASGVLAQGNGSRSCAHFFHQRCLTDLLRCK